MKSFGPSSFALLCLAAACGNPQASSSTSDTGSTTSRGSSTNGASSTGTSTNGGNSTSGSAAAPMVLSNSPPDGATAVALNANVSATFSEAMDPSTLTATTFTLTTGAPAVAVPGTV